MTQEIFLAGYLVAMLVTLFIALVLLKFDRIEGDEDGD